MTNTSVGEAKQLIGMVIPDGTNQFFSTVAQAFQKRLNSRGYAMVVLYSDGSLSRELAHLDLLQRLEICGLVMISVGEHGEAFRRLRDFNAAILVLDREIPHENADFVMIDNAVGSELAVRHLHGLGHRRLGYVTGSLQTQPGRERRDGAVETAEHLGVAIKNSHMVEGDFQVGSGLIAADHFLSLPGSDRPSAIMCANDLMAFGLMSRLQAGGVSIPEDISVLGYDDVPMSSLVYPNLTSIRQDPNEIALEGCALLMSRVDADAAGAGLPDRRVRVIQPRLMTRSSTAENRPLEGR